MTRYGVSGMYDPTAWDATRAMCALVWMDGWADDHHCHLPPGHEPPCRCHCDSEMSTT